MSLPALSDAVHHKGKWPAIVEHVTLSNQRLMALPYEDRNLLWLPTFDISKGKSRPPSLLARNLLAPRFSEGHTKSDIWELESLFCLFPVVLSGLEPEDDQFIYSIIAGLPGLLHLQTAFRAHLSGF